MSIIFGFKHDHAVYMAADREYMKNGGVVIPAQRIWRLPAYFNNHIIIGCDGRAELLTRLKRDFKLSSSFSTGKKDWVDEYIGGALIEQLTECLSASGMLKKTDDGRIDLGANFLFAVEDFFYSIDRYCNVVAVDDFCAAGTGANFAINGLISTEATDEPHERINSVMETCKRCDQQISYPFTTITTKEGGYEW